MTSQDIFPEKFSEVSRNRSVCDTTHFKAHFRVRYPSDLSPKSFKTSDFDYLNDCLFILT